MLIKLLKINLNFLNYYILKMKILSHLPTIFIASSLPYKNNVILQINFTP